MKDLIIVLLVVLGIVFATLTFPKTLFFVVLGAIILLFSAIKIVTTPIDNSQL